MLWIHHIHVNFTKDRSGLEALPRSLVHLKRKNGSLSFCATVFVVMVVVVVVVVVVAAAGFDNVFFLGGRLS